jgi:hypothetical protein
MPVLVTAEVAGQTEQGYDAMLERLSGALRAAPGFVLHAAHPIDGGWRVLEIWDSAADASRFFGEHVHPHLPPEIRPRRSVQMPYSLVCR